jgi:hypothetical protein
LALAMLAACGLALAGSATAGASSEPGGFYSYAGNTPLSRIAPGTVLKTRTVSYHIVGIPLPVRVVQLLYRSTGALSQPTTNVTSILEPPVKHHPIEVVSLQSAYDSLSPADEPSREIEGNATIGGAIWDVESALVVPLLSQGYTIVASDTEGQSADFAAGTIYGMNALDSIRAATSSRAADVPAKSPVALIGYSGGAIGTDWTAQLAPSYAPDVNRRLVGAAEGGVLVDPLHNLSYINGSTLWAGVMPMAIIGIARGYQIDLSPYLSAYGSKVYAEMQSDSITNVLAQYPGLTWDELVKPQYHNPNSVKPLVEVGNKLDLGAVGMPTIPFFIGQGAGGVLEGTPVGGPGIGPGDGVMITGDVRTLARDFCAAHDAVDYEQYNTLGHVGGMVVWAPQALAWVLARLADKPAPNTCASIAPGNSLALQTYVGP